MSASVGCLGTADTLCLCPRSQHLGEATLDWKAVAAHFGRSTQAVRSKYRHLKLVEEHGTEVFARGRSARAPISYSYMALYALSTLPDQVRWQILTGYHFVLRGICIEGIYIERRAFWGGAKPDVCVALACFSPAAEWHRQRGVCCCGAVPSVSAPARPHLPPRLHWRVPVRLLCTVFSRALVLLYEVFHTSVGLPCRWQQRIREELSHQCIFRATGTKRGGEMVWQLDLSSIDEIPRNLRKKVAEMKLAGAPHMGKHGNSNG